MSYLVVIITNLSQIITAIQHGRVMVTLYNDCSIRKFYSDCSIRGLCTECSIRRCSEKKGRYILHYTRVYFNHSQL